MARSAFGTFLTAVAKDAARRQRLAEQAQARSIREQARAERERAKQQRLNSKAQKDAAREARQQYIEDQIAAAAEKTEDVAATMNELSQLLEATLKVDDRINFDSLRLPLHHPTFSPPSDLAKPCKQPRPNEYVPDIPEPTGLSRFIPGAKKRYEEAVASANERFRLAVKGYEAAEHARKGKLTQLQAAYEESKKTALEKARQRNAEVDELVASYQKCETAAVVAYTSMVLERSRYPEGFPQEFQLAYVPGSKQLVIDYELPEPNIVPVAEEYRYAKSKDEIEAKPRKAAHIKELYQDIVAAVALRTIHEVFEADQAGHIEVIAFSGFVNTIDRATGKARRPCLISVQVTKKRFLDVDLSKIDKKACLRNLGAHVSQSPNEMVAVKPVVEFDMVDKRFVEQGNILSDLESRPNLMDLKPFEFETLVANLFQHMGIESKLTRSSRDGGVDVVGFDKRPILGGKVVIQAKRYRNTVGVSAVRDLYGTMMNEGANKGILVATSGYGPDAFEFVKDKPIELIDGGGLLYLLEQTGVKARIVMPTETGI